MGIRPNAMHKYTIMHSGIQVAKKQTIRLHLVGVSVPMTCAIHIYICDRHNLTGLKPLPTNLLASQTCQSPVHEFSCTEQSRCISLGVQIAT